MLPQPSINLSFLSVLIIPNLTWLGVVGVVIDYEFFRGRKFETVVNEPAWPAAWRPRRSVSSPYKMAYHGSTENGINWNDGHIDYKGLHTVLKRPWSVSHNSTPTASHNARSSQD